MTDVPEDEEFARIALDMSTFAAVGRQFAIEKASRTPNSVRVSALVLDRAQIQPDFTFLSPGTAALVVSSDSEVLEAVKSGVSDGSYSDLEIAIKGIISKFSELKPSHYSPVSEAAHIVDVTVDGRGVAENILLEDSGSYADIYPYMGGDLNLGQLSAVDYTSTDAQRQLQAILILSQPDLTDVERAVLAALPQQRTATVGDGVVAAIPAVWAAARGAWAAYQVSKYLYKEYRQWKARRAQVGRAQFLSVNEPTGAEIPDSATVSELLEARAHLLRGRIDS